jgi:hypothetical protein
VASLCLNKHHWFSDVRCISLHTEYTSRLQFTSSLHLTCFYVLSFEHIDESVCFVCVVMFHAHLFSVYVWSVVHMHRAGQAASQYCVVPAVGSIPHRVAYSSDLVPNSELVQYSSDVLSVLSTIPDCFDLVIRESLILCSCLVIHASLWNVSYCM